MPLTEEQPQGENSGTSARSRGVERVGVRIPPFWPERPAVWFAQLEGQFILSNITVDSTKFYMVAANLDPSIASEVDDIIVSPPATGMYEKLKTEVIKRLSVSQQRKTLQLLTHEELGDRKPSQFLRHLRNLAGPKVHEEFLREMWTSKLPANLQTIVISQAECTLDAVADLADRVHEIVPPHHQVASTSTDLPGTALERRVAELTRQVEALSTQVRDARFYSDGPRGRSQYRRPSRTRHQRSRSRSKTRPEGHRYCFYHYRFGARAEKCTEPCSFKSENLSGSH